MVTAKKNPCQALDLAGVFLGEPAGIRTRDPMIKSNRTNTLSSRRHLAKKTLKCQLFNMLT